MNMSLDKTLSWRERLFRSIFPLLLSDLFAIVTAYYATLLVRFHSSSGKAFFAWINSSIGVRESAEVGLGLEHFYWYSAPRLMTLLAITLISLYGYLNLYAGRRLIRKYHEVWNMILANLIALGLFYGYFYLTRNEFHPRSVFGTLLALNVVISILYRLIMTRLLNSSRLAICRVLIVGDGPETDFIGRYIDVKHPEGLEIVARLPVTSPLAMEPLLDQIKVLVTTHRTQMIICTEKHLTVGQIMQLLELGEILKQEVKVLSDKLNILVNEAEIPCDFLMELPLMHFSVSPVGSAGQRFRQTISRVMSAIILLLATPFMLVIAGLIKLSGPGPVFFMQDRIGINRIPFRMFKFRTMHERAEELQAQIEEFNESGEGLFKIKRDPRVTGVGRFLRRFSLDELPQLINVLKGEMTLVGPRPLPRRDFENYYEEWHYSRHSGLPGLTCLWQVSGRSDISFHNMCILDDYYLRNQNALLDLKIIVRTIRVVLFAKGAY